MYGKPKNYQVWLGQGTLLYRLYGPEMEIMAKYHQELIFISGMGMHVKNTVTVKRSGLFF
jgi:hypothetical protein